jgi:integrase
VEAGNAGMVPDGFGAAILTGVTCDSRSDRKVGSAAAPSAGLRFHDLRHQAITELAEAGAQDSVIQSIAGHLSKRMLDHYSHIRRAAKRDATHKLSDGLMNPAPAAEQKERRTVTLSG